MKKITSILSLLLLFTFSIAQAQVATISIDDQAAIAGSEISVPLSTNNDLEDIGSLTLNITYDSDVLTFSNQIANSDLLTAGNLQVNHTENGANSVISIGWFSVDPITLQDKILDLKFVYIEGTSTLAFSGTNEFTDSDNALVNVAYTDGSVFPVGQGPLSFALSDEVGNTGDQVTVDLSAKNINEMGAMQFEITYDSSVLEFVGLSDDVLGFTVNSATDGVVKLAWFSTDGYSLVEGVLAGLDFDFSGGTSAVAFNASAVELTKLDETSVNATLTDGSVMNTPTGFILSDATAYLGGDANVTLSATNVSDLGAFQLYINYDADSLTFVELANQEAAGTFSANASNGLITLGYFNVDGLTVTNEPLVDLVFTYNGGSTAVEFDEAHAGTEVVDINEAPINVVYTDGSVSLNAANQPPVFVNVLPDTTITGGEALAYTYTATDSDDDAVTFALVSGPEGMTVSDAGALAWTPDTDADSAYTVVVSATDGTDSVNDTATVTVVPGILDLTIQQIQTPTDDTDASPYVGMTVRTTGVVTAIDTLGDQGYFIQDGTGDYSGVFVYDNDNTPAVGDNITIVAEVSEYYNLTELGYVSSITVNSSGNDLPAAQLITLAEAGEPLEGVLVSVDSVLVLDSNYEYGEWLVTDGVDSLQIDEQLFAFVPDSGKTYSVTGPLNYTYSQYKIAPRNMDDIVLIKFPDTGVMALDLNTGNLGFTMFNDGNLGYHDDGDLPNRGVGITWKGANGLWKAAAVYGRTSVGLAVGNANNNGGVALDDVQNIESYWGMFGLQSEEGFDQVTPPAVFDDNLQGEGLYTDIPVTVKAYANTGEDWIYLRYGFTNNTGAEVNDLVAGLFADLDVTDDYTNNKAGYAEGEWMIYEYINDSNPYYGLAAVNKWDAPGGATVTSSNVSQDEFRSKAFEYITNQDFTAPPTGDQRSWIGIKVPNIAVGETQWVTFTILAADNLEDLRHNADLAVRKAIDDLGWAEEGGYTDVDGNLNVVPEEYSLSQNYPNPFNPSTSITFGLPEASQVKLSVYNLLGETVDVLVSTDMSAGYHSVNWNASNLASGIYFYTIEAHSASGKDFNVVKKMMLLK